MRRAFSLVEIMIVVVIMGIMAAFAVPQFGKAMARAHARDAINNLNIIHSANLMNKARTGENISAVDLEAINTGLGLNVIANGADYSCQDAECMGVGSDFTVIVRLDSPLGTTLGTTNPSCLGAGCP
jgi:prepilin-type N-terminal cleavage/methylation domain-containing protein